MDDRSEIHIIEPASKDVSSKFSITILRLLLSHEHRLPELRRMVFGPIETFKFKLRCSTIRGRGFE